MNAQVPKEFRAPRLWAKNCGASGLKDKE